MALCGPERQDWDETLREAVNTGFPEAGRGGGGGAVDGGLRGGELVDAGPGRWWGQEGPTAARALRRTELSNIEAS